jgi:DNA polymerase III subunit chi
MTEVWFFHLDQQPLEHVLPRIVGSSLARGWRMVIETTQPEHIAKISEMLWASEDVAFLPHGFEGEPSPDQQPVWLTATGENPNTAQVRVLLDGAAPKDISNLTRAVLMFDGNDPQAIEAARDEWKAQKAAGHDISYWKQDEAGKWQNQAKRSNLEKDAAPHSPHNPAQSPMSISDGS